MKRQKTLANLAVLGMLKGKVIRYLKMSDDYDTAFSKEKIIKFVDSLDINDFNTCVCCFSSIITESMLDMLEKGYDIEIIKKEIRGVQDERNI